MDHQFFCILWFIAFNEPELGCAKMMDEIQFSDWLTRNQFNPTTAALITRIRTSEPTRRVQGGKSNVTGRYPSRKMGHTVQFESHKVELAFIREYEFDDNVLEYYDQPGPIKISYRASTGRQTTVLTTPDFFVIRNDGTADWEECKVEQELERLAEKSERFVRNDEKQWRCPPGEEYAGKYGLNFRVRSSAEINWVWQRNIEYLSDYLQAPDYPVGSEAESFLKALVSCRQGIFLSELIGNSERFTADDIFQLIARNELYVNLHVHPLNEHDKTPVYTSREHSSISMPTAPTFESSVTVEPGSTLIWDGRLFQIINCGDENIYLKNEQGGVTPLGNNEFEGLVKIGAIRGLGKGLSNNDICELLHGKGPMAHEDANRKYSAILPYLSGDVPDRPSSTIYSWLKRYREAEIRYGYGYLGLLDRKSERGNRLPKLPAESYNLMQVCIDEQYLITTQINPITLYGHYCNECEKKDVIAASFKTVTKVLKKLDAKKVENSRKGFRAAYQLDVFHWELEMTTPRHGDRPFEIVHLDHTELDIQLVDSVTGNNLGRPWLTLMVDANSRCILAYILSFEPPSYRSCMMVIRECVRIYNRLPQNIVVDGGADFNSVYFEQLMAFHGIVKKSRPGAQPRYGSVLERLFGVTNTQFVHSLLGNTKIMVNVRQVTKSVNPANLAVWTLPKLKERIGRYFAEVYEDLDHPALGESPQKAFERGLAKHGARPMKLMRYDESFIIGTLPSTPKGHAKVIRSRGIKINNFYYWHELLHSATGLDVPVRYDPFDIGTAYAFVKNKWQRCTSQYYARLQGRSEKEIAMITQEIIRRRSNHNKKLVINAQKVAAFIAETQDVESELKEMRKAAEIRKIRDVKTERVENEADFPALPYFDNDFEVFEEI